EGIGYWGLASIAAVAVAPPIAFWLLERGGWWWVAISCGALNLLMGAIAWTLDDSDHVAQVLEHEIERGPLVDRRVLALSFTLFLYSFSYGAITSFSAVYADAIGVTPKSVYLSTLAVVILFTRPLSSALADRVGYRRVLAPALVLIAVGLTVLAAGGPRGSFIGSAIVFGLGFGTAYPVFAAYVMRDVDPRRRGAAFGAILACFDTGIGTGSTAVGWLIQQFGFTTAFGTAAALSAAALPYFLVVDRELGRRK